MKFCLQRKPANTSADCAHAHMSARASCCTETKSPRLVCEFQSLPHERQDGSGLAARSCRTASAWTPSPPFISDATRSDRPHPFAVQGFNCEELLYYDYAGMDEETEKRLNARRVELEDLVRWDTI